jgi:hypothetical protein
MAFREVSVIEVREVLRGWLAGAGLRKVAEQAGVDRKTARRYVEAATEAGLARDGGPGHFNDTAIGSQRRDGAGPRCGCVINLARPGWVDPHRCDIGQTSLAQTHPGRIRWHTDKID